MLEQRGCSFAATRAVIEELLMLTPQSRANAALLLQDLIASHANVNAALNKQPVQTPTLLVDNS